MSNEGLKYKFRRAIYLLVACDMSIPQVAEQMGVNERTLKRWMSNPQFSALVQKKYDEIEKQDSKKFRSMNIKLISERIYGEIQRRLTEPDAFDDMSLVGLLRTARDLNFEHRIDNNQPTTRTETLHVLDSIMLRFANAIQRGDLAAVVNGPVLEGQKPRLMLVEPPVSIAEKRKEKVHG